MRSAHPTVSSPGTVIAQCNRATVDDICNDETCDDDYTIALQTARMLLGHDASEDQCKELMREVIEEVHRDLTTPPRCNDLRRVADRLINLRTEQPEGLVVLDSRDLDGLLGDVEAGWS